MLSSPPPSPTVHQEGKTHGRLCHHALQKLSGIGSVAASLKHCFRERDTPNADPKDSGTNMHMAARSTDEAMGKLREKLPEKRRKDAVLAIEYVLSASPEWWINADSGRKTDFYQSSMDWLAEKYGRENILVSSIHLDEKTPHMSRSWSRSPKMGG
ncbi:plasmid recombination protein [Klebsiella michiganensis]|uniref:plasmid recombination protein n=1 Tax=Klebsiella michiganensis TaxID=1134687 RepID=UPI000AEC817D|nr:plasmid recombination protein [Klebsiella michiganensis]